MWRGRGLLHARDDPDGLLDTAAGGLLDTAAAADVPRDESLARSARPFSEATSREGDVPRGERHTRRRGRCRVVRRRAREAAAAGQISASVSVLEGHRRPARRRTTTRAAADNTDGVVDAAAACADARGRSLRHPGAG